MSKCTNQFLEVLQTKQCRKMAYSSITTKCIDDTKPFILVATFRYGESYSALDPVK